MDTNTNNREKKNEDSITAKSFSFLEKPENNRQNNSSKNLRVIITIIIIFILVITAGYLINKYTSINLVGSKTDNFFTNDYNAVFLSNGQVYFGRINKVDNRHTVLVDIYYLQVSNPPLQQAPTKQTVGQPELSLIKLGNELHGPEDKMTINNDHILFIEKLRQDGKVVKAIMNNKEKNQ